MKLAILMSTLFINSLALAQSVDSDWQKFQQDPKAAMQSIPKKLDQKGQQVQQRQDSLFTNDEIDSKLFLKAKKETRSQLQNEAPPPLNKYEGINLLKNRIANFLDLKEFQAKQIAPVYTLKEIEEQKLMSAQLEQVPWSDSYWPIYKGILGARYNSDHFNEVGIDWADMQTSVTGNNSLSAVLKRANADEIANLSPSEKYDLLIGMPDSSNSDIEGFLTPHMWEEGRRYYTSTGEVAMWMGICHGWAPASFMAPAPTNIVETSSAVDGLKLQFYPSDLKGLTSFLWANSVYDSSFIGGRCNVEDVKTDEETGRILDDNCFDVNPAVWHLALVNQIGKAKRSFVMDASFDYEVWNQPVVSYSIQYLNPQTAVTYDSFEKAKISLSSYKKDKFKKWRSRLSKEVVGVRMEVTYVIEQSPTHDLADSAPFTRTVNYNYDLELDERGEIIGGEWYNQAHPDFLWLPRANAKAVSEGDSAVEQADWNVAQPLPEFWKQIARATAVNYGMPLAKITELLVEKSNQ